MRWKLRWFNPCTYTSDPFWHAVAVPSMDGVSAYLAIPVTAENPNDELFQVEDKALDAADGYARWTP